MVFILDIDLKSLCLRKRVIGLNLKEVHFATNHVYCLVAGDLRLFGDGGKDDFLFLCSDQLDLL